MIWMVLGVAFAHPFESSAWSMRSSLKAENDKLDIVVAVEAPTLVVLRALAETTNAVGDGFSKAELEKAVDAYNDAMWSSLADDLSVTIDGQPRELVFAPVNSPINGRASERFFLYLVQAQWPIPPSSQTFTVSLENTAQADEDVYLTVSTIGRGGWRVVDEDLNLRLGECSPEFTDAETTDQNIDEDGQVWRQDPSLRNVRASFQRTG